MPTKKKKTSAKKPAKKAVAKPAKSAKPKAKPAKKTSAKRAATRGKDLAVKPVTDPVAGIVTMKSADDVGEATEGEVMTVKPELDDSGCLIMVPQVK